ncbi:hypothetical protein AGMMS49940_17080 [Spirochaetia bacterium]|nr:hypothetical protein AGMMS49940_17080 [Spirochaetia bacterium]
MALINFRPLVLPALILFLAGTVSAQSGLATEIGNIETKLGSSALSAAERRESYIRLAQLQRLSGNVDVSARAWREAGLSDPENRDDRCFLESALCYLTLGEFDAAADALRGILAGGRDTAAIRDAYYIAALIEVFRRGSPDALYTLLGKPEFHDYRPAIYYTFWRLFGDGAYKAQILSEFPKSPEAGILQGEMTMTANSNAVGNTVSGVRVSALNRPLWFFYPGRGSVTIGAAVPASPAGGPLTLGPTVSSVRAGETLPTAAAASASAGPRALQTGIFNREENARAMAARLVSRGFTAELSQKPINGVTHWTVNIPAGENANQTMLALKDAGFESFPVF